MFFDAPVSSGVGVCGGVGAGVGACAVGACAPPPRRSDFLPLDLRVFEGVGGNIPPAFAGELDTRGIGGEYGNSSLARGMHASTDRSEDPCIDHTSGLTARLAFICKDYSPSWSVRLDSIPSQNTYCLASMAVSDMQLLYVHSNLDSCIKRTCC